MLHNFEAFELQDTLKDTEKKQKITKNSKTSRLAILPINTQLIYLSLHCW